MLQAAHLKTCPGVLAAGGYGPGDALHQLKEPVDVTVDATGISFYAGFEVETCRSW